MPDADTGDPRLVELVGEPSLRSERFRTLWARQDVKHKATGTSLFNHPQVGPLELHYERLLIPTRGRHWFIASTGFGFRTYRAPALRPGGQPRRSASRFTQAG